MGQSLDCVPQAYAPVYRYFAVANTTECRSCINAYPIPIKNTTAVVWL